MRFLNNILLTLKTIKDIKIFFLDYLGLLSGDVVYQIKNTQAKFITRSRTPDIDEVIMINSGFEYRLSEISARKNLVIFDVGAHIGSFSVYASNFFKMLKPRIYAFEPDKDNYKYLNLNITLNGLNNISLFNLAISNYDGHGFLNSLKMQMDA